MPINDDCPIKSNEDLTTAADLDAVMADLPPFTDAELQIAAGFASELSPADIREIRHFDSPALSAADAELERRQKEIAAKSAKQARDDYALIKLVETGELPRDYNPTGIAPRHKANGHFQFETEEEYKRRYDRELKRKTRPEFVKLTDEEKKARKKASNAKRKAR